MSPGAHGPGTIASPKGPVTTFNNHLVPARYSQKTLPGGTSIVARPKGGIRDVYNPNKGIGVHNTITGARQVTTLRPDGSRIYAERGRPGYIERGYTHNGRQYSQRAYYDHGRVYERYYQSYSYHGVYMNVYAPAQYYAMGFYGWAYNPWYQPVVYGWGWGPSPWVTFYGGYFTPYPVYPNASLWLTDYMVASDLQAQYQANQEAQLAAQPVAAQGQPELTPEIKDQIATEVRNQLALETDEAKQTSAGQVEDASASSVGNMLADGQPHVFVVAGPMDLLDASGTECALTAGDVLSLGANSSLPSDAQAADLVVLASKGGQECQKAGTVTVQISDLQEMQNHMRETIDQGLGELQAKAGKSGIPAAPPSAQGQPTMTTVAQDAPPPDPAGAAQINQQLQDADTTMNDATNQARQAGVDVPPSAPVTVTAGQTIEQVQAALGQPSQVVDLGVKKVYMYNNMKITFLNGKVKDVQ
jgi:hypothetical protein